MRSVNWNGSRLVRRLGSAAVLVGMLAVTSMEGAAIGAPAARPLPVAVGLLYVMRASVEISADGIWDAQSAEKMSDADWLLADQDSASLAAAATLVSMGGNGKNDAKWVANADWQAWTRDLQKTSLDIRAAAAAKDQAKLGTLADHLTEVCQNCHTKYRPENPSDGIARYPFYPKRVLAK